MSAFFSFYKFMSTAKDKREQILQDDCISLWLNVWILLYFFFGEKVYMKVFTYRVFHNSWNKAVASQIFLVDFILFFSLFRFGWVSLFYGISTFIGYLMPKPFSLKNSSGTI